MLPSDEEANLFVTIYTEQKSVPKHLLDDLMGDLERDSTIPSERIAAISARLIGLLNADVDEAFYNRITRTGMSSTNKTCLMIPALKEALRRSGLLGRSLMKNSNYELGARAVVIGQTLDRARSALNS